MAVLTFNDPDRRNAISDEMNVALDEAFDDLEADEDIGAVVLIGAGRAFCAGAVLDDLLGAGESEERSSGDLPSIYRGFLRVAHSPLATVAAVNGAAVGAGMNMLLACDLVVAGRSAKFDTRFLSIGLHPGGGHIWRLRHLTDLGTTRAMVLFQQVLDGEEAVRRGLAWECVDDETLLDAAVAYAELAAAHPPGPGGQHQGDHLRRPGDHRIGRSGPARDRPADPLDAPAGLPGDDPRPQGAHQQKGLRRRVRRQSSHSRHRTSARSAHSSAVRANRRWSSQTPSISR